ncbi:MAG: DUF4232 domain-containing protein [Ktedonobacterales bacterium]
MSRSIWRRCPQQVALGLVMALGLALASCDAQAAATSSPSATPTAAASPTVAPSPTATFVVLPDDASVTYGPACTAAQLKLSWAISFSSADEMGTLTNSSSAACSLFGFPGAQLLDAQRQPLTTQVSRATSGVWGGVMPEQRLQVAPGGSVYIAVKWANSGAQGACAAAAYLALTPPAGASAVMASDPITVCGGALTISPFQIAPFMAS